MLRSALFILALAVSQAACAQRSRLESLGVEPTAPGPRELAATMKRDYERWGPIIKASGFKPEN